MSDTDEELIKRAKLYAKSFGAGSQTAKLIDRLASRLEALAGEEDAQVYKDALHDLVQLRAEEWAIGGGPGFKDRQAKAWRAAEELFEP